MQQYNQPETSFLDGEWGKFTLLLAGLIVLLGAVVVIANLVST